MLVRGGNPAFPLGGVERKPDAEVPPLYPGFSSEPGQRSALLFTLDPALADFNQPCAFQASARAPHRLDLAPVGQAARTFRGQL